MVCANTKQFQRLKLIVYKNATDISERQFITRTTSFSQQKSIYNTEINRVFFCKLKKKINKEHSIPTSLASTARSLINWATPLR